MRTYIMLELWHAKLLLSSCKFYTGIVKEVVADLF